MSQNSQHLHIGVFYSLRTENIWVYFCKFRQIVGIARHRIWDRSQLSLEASMNERSDSTCMGTT